MSDDPASSPPPRRTTSGIGPGREIRSIRVVDSHTAGEPTRVVLDGWPQPEGVTMAERRDFMAREQDALRNAVVVEPRGHDAVVGALLTPPVHPGSIAGVVFFNNVGYLGMCGHGLIGVARTLEFLGRLEKDAGTIRIDTPVGTVSADLLGEGQVEIRNVEPFAHAFDVSVDVPGWGEIRGDIAYGGNWFFIAHLAEPEVIRGNLHDLLSCSRAILAALRKRGITGADGAEIDHVELSAPSTVPGEGTVFVLCPGGDWDRSPCGTGTSARMAVLHARGELAIGESWLQRSILGTVFEGRLEEIDGRRVPHIRGSAFVTGRAELLFDPQDPFRTGFPAR